MANDQDQEDVELTSERFDELDLDHRAKRVLKDKGYTYLTHVQSKVLPLALSGKNLIIQSPTGSGKTLCFLLPAVKLLYDEGYYGELPSDASLLGCICLASTRELATQSAIQMDDLCKPLGIRAGCCIGGIRDKFDKGNARKLQILTGTPGRVLALLSNQSISDTGNVKLLVLDEADRLLDSGFRNDILDIMGYMPPSTQILLFSATIKSSLKNLCDSLLQGKEYEFVCLGSDAALLSADKLRQEYILVPMSLKLPALFHLLSKNQNKRFIVFLATCKHVRLVFEVFKRLIPAVPMTEWHGKQSQLKRNEQFTRFAAKQNNGCIFTTDVGSRGVDFPAVDYVVQLDIPDSVNTYTHRVGRTGRLTVEGTRSFGIAFSIISENEASFVEQLKTSGVKLHNLTKLLLPFLQRKENYVLQKLQALMAKEAWIKEIAQRAVISYMRYLSTRKSVTLSGAELVESVQQMALASGLPSAPQITVNDNTSEKPSKLSKLKEKIKAKKQLSNETKVDIASESDVSSTVVDSDESSDESDADTDNILTRVGTDAVDDDLKHYIEQKATEDNEDVKLKANLASTRKKFRLNRHGVAKLRGVETIKQTEQKHVVFEADSDEEVEDERYQDEVPTLVDISTEKKAYMERLNAQLKETAAHDQEWEARRRAIKRAKKLNKPLPI
ncbi:DEAD/DEAH box helicase family protein [Babesia bovis T2Bo]|uniref:ATP-dependent RNA helicase n=1 Tax=Babesia bovis TaxID=5865 RepID=A7AU89_BABBO|nr:DEAD/DEAH box helicase family protein [Babesia bovis T2Bo]EDO06500.1 DEAD/DEAH box helicase family protein [Babesia bovis T2Bo]|eukprot:XP_001610068.1 DEAD/DEAH box helicase family protein [Babesia bovis T2Bo]